MSDTITIPARFRGPPETGNGGFVCGLVDSHVVGDAEVTLRSPPPLETPLDVVASDGGVRVYNGETLIAEAGTALWDLQVATPPSWEQARAAEAGYLGLEHHEFAECVVCGPDRTPGDGYRIFPGPAGGRGMVASTWRPHPSLPASDGQLHPEAVWAALDCPGAWADARDMRETPVVLGRMAARLEGSCIVGDDHVVIAWPLASEGRKFFAGTALFTIDGSLVGAARQTWIVLAPQPD